MSELTLINWCTTHGSREGEDGLCLWVLIENRWNAYGVDDCEFIVAKVVEASA